MPFVLDASMTMSWFFANEETPETRAVLEYLDSTFVEVPPLWPYEVLNAIASSIRRKRTTEAAAEVFLKRLARLDIKIESHPRLDFDSDLLSLATRHNLTAYDAAYLDLALRKGYPLATLDQQLIDASKREGISLLGQIV